MHPVCPMNEPIRIGVLGCGAIGAIHAEAISQIDGYRLTAAQFAYDGGMELLEETLAYYDTYTCDHAYQWPVGATLTDEESTDFMSAGSGDLVTYIQEQIIMFCTGDRPMSEWDSYIETLNSLGLQECIAIYQGCYDRYKAERG